MSLLQVIPPNPDNEALLGEIPGLRQTAIPVVAFDGPEGHLGPEAAGAVLLLHMTMTGDDARAQAFWRQVAATCKAASQTPGFIRLISFFDGMANWALGFWKRAADAEGFAKSPVHRAAMAEMYETNFEYMHFAGIFEAVNRRPRHGYCSSCGTEVEMPASACPSCGEELADVFVIQSAALRPVSGDEGP